MSLKSTIITKLKEKAKELGANLSNVRINSLAEKLDAIVDSEDAIDGEIEKLDSVFSFKELAALDDAKRNAEKKKAEEGDDDGKKADDKTDKTDATDKTDDTPAWALAMIESNKALQAEIATIKEGNVSKSRRSQLEAKLQDAPEKFKARTLRDFDRLKLDSDDDFTDYLADIEQDVSDEIQAQSDEGLGNDSPVRGLGGSGKLKEEDVSPAMKELLADREAEAKAKATVTA